MNEIEIDPLVSVILPCLNEAETLEICIKRAQGSLSSLKVDFEIIVADNGSSDGSQAIAIANGAKLVSAPIKGYGAAIMTGIQHSRGKYILMADADDSYDLDNLGVFVESLKSGNELVIGNRFSGGIAKGAMPWLHKYIGNPLLSWLGRTLFNTPIRDFHCGLRGFEKVSILKLKLKSFGMEFASEMIVKASLNSLKISEVPTTLRPDGRSRKPHLRTWRDGWRHLVFLLASSPRWTFLYPGLFTLLVGSSATILGITQTSIFDVNTYLIGIGLMICGIQLLLFAILSRIFASEYDLLPNSNSFSKFYNFFSLEKGVTVGLSLILFATYRMFSLLLNWMQLSYGHLDLTDSIHSGGITIFTLVSGVSILFASFFASMLQTSRD